jgi:hypothetical protein
VGLLKISKDEIIHGRRLLHEFTKGSSGGFYTALFVSIGRADDKNIKKLAKGFPGLVWAYLEQKGTLSKVDWEYDESADVKKNSVIIPFKKQEKY